MLPHRMEVFLKLRIKVNDITLPGLGSQLEGSSRELISSPDPCTSFLGNKTRHVNKTRLILETESKGAMTGSVPC